LKIIKFSTQDNDAVIANQIELSEHEYSKLSDAKKVLKRVLKHEELYDQVIESYVDAKSAMYEMSIRAISQSDDFNYVKNHYYRSKLNRLYFNTLNLSKLYLDKHYFEHKDRGGEITSITCFAEKITNSIDDLDEIKRHRTEMLETNFAYALGCELRNFVQHSSLPVNTFTTGVRYSPQDKQTSAVFHVTLDRKELINGRVRKNRLTAYGDKIDLHEVMDGYISAISKMHLKSRSLVEKHVAESEELIDSKRREIESSIGNFHYGIEVVDADSDERLFSLHLDWFDVVEHLKKKNSHALNFERFTHKPYQKNK
jgi:hypothetical protein